MSWLTYLYWAFFIPCSAYVFWKGGPPEKIGISIALAASIASNLAVSATFGLRFRQVEIGVFWVDVATFTAFLALALYADRFWPLWVTGMHLVGVATHTAMLVSPAVVPWVYGWIQGFWAYPIILLIVVGAARHQRRLRLYGADNSWSGSFAAAGRTVRRNGPTGS